MIYYNQNNYPNNPYPAPGYPNATIKSGGCGPTSMAMIVSNLTGQEIDPPTMAQFAINCGARVSGGSDMDVLAENTCKEFGLTFSTTSDENELLAHLQSGGMAIANVGGNRTGYTGVFSNGGHYIVDASFSDGMVGNMDPGYYAGKYSITGRKGKVSVVGNICYCSVQVLAEDTANRSPAYWLFRKKVEEVPEWMKQIIAEAKAFGLITKDHDPMEPATKWFVLATVIQAIKIIRGGN